MGPCPGSITSLRRGPYPYSPASGIVRPEARCLKRGFLARLRALIRKMHLIEKACASSQHLHEGQVPETVRVTETRLFGFPCPCSFQFPPALSPPPGTQPDAAASSAAAMAAFTCHNLHPVRIPANRRSRNPCHLKTHLVQLCLQRMDGLSRFI